MANLKTVNSYNIEFAYELISILPYAYSLYQKGLLGKTISGTDTKCLYWFSPEHEENESPRSWENMKNAWNEKIPNIKIHQPTLDWDNFSPPPLKNQYKNNIFIFDKPIICICNRINIEWGRSIINYFDNDSLRYLFNLLKNKYQIIYFNIRGMNNNYSDGVIHEDIGDYEMILKEYPEVITIHDLLKKHTEYSFNLLQLMVMSNCDNFITMCGGYGVLASYMGGTNIIYTKESREILPDVNSFYRWYHKFGDSRIVHCGNYDELYKKVKSIFVDKEPLVNIVIRTSNRPKYFDNCIKSIYNQTYQNINIIVGIDNKNESNYVIPYKIYPVYYDKISDSDKVKTFKTDNMGRVYNDYGMYFPYNLYLNIIFEHLKEGLVMGLDDDDMFYDNRALSIIINKIKNIDNTLVFWRVLCGSKIIPSDENFGKRPVCKDISGIGFMYSTKWKNHFIWEGYKRADYRVANKLYDLIENKIYINKILTMVQIEQNSGKKSDRKLILFKKNMKVKLKVSLSGPDAVHLSGNIITVGKEQGRRLIEADFAEEVL